MENLKIIIEITESDIPPKVTVDGEEVQVVLLDYKYEAGNTSEHKFNLVMPSTINGVDQTHGLAFDRGMAKN